MPRHRGRVEELPPELAEDDGKFARITEDDPAFGPPVLMITGCTNEEVVQVQKMLKRIEGDFLEVKVCTKEMGLGSLEAAILTNQPDPLSVEPCSSHPRICFLSGLTGEEIMMLIDAFPAAGMETPVMAAMVPNNAHKPMTQLFEEIMGDYTRLAEQRQQRRT
eukprot:SM000010S04348  [mRNA]  locus=s10:1172382:1174583:+ [translate_table: standard]